MSKEVRMLNEISKALGGAEHVQRKDILEEIAGLSDSLGPEQHILPPSQVDPETGLPMVEDPEEGAFYLVPSGEESPNLYNEYIWTGEGWELFGSGGAALKNMVDGSAQGSVRGVMTAEEDENYTIGSGAHAEGGGTKASSNYAHAEGGGTTASGNNSHAEGATTTASGPSSHAEGSITKASGAQSHAEGGGTTASGSSSHAEGATTTASGYSSHAEGASTTASGDNSHAEGSGSNVAIQYNQLGSGSAKIVPGAKSAGSHVEGCQTTTNDYTSAVHAEGYQTIAGKIGDDGQPGDHAEGYQTYASGGASHAEGGSTTASGSRSHAEGSVTTASGANSHAEGDNTRASGSDSHAEGDNTRASGSDSHAEGSSTTASGLSSHAEGGGTTASGDRSHAEGNNTIANHQSQHVHGEYNVADPSTAPATARGNYVEIVGNGTAYNARSNARTLDWSGNEWLAGKLTVGAAPTNDMDVATKKYVDENAGGGGYSLPVLTITAHPGMTTTYDIDWTFEQLSDYQKSISPYLNSFVCIVRYTGMANQLVIGQVYKRGSDSFDIYTFGGPSSSIYFPISYEQKYSCITIDSSNNVVVIDSNRRAKTITLGASDWVSNTQTVSVQGVTDSEKIVLVTPAPASVKDWDAAYVICTGQGIDSLTFTCDTVPTNDITVNVVIL